MLITGIAWRTFSSTFNALVCGLVGVMAAIRHPKLILPRVKNDASNRLIIARQKIHTTTFHSNLCFSIRPLKHGLIMYMHLI